MSSSLQDICIYFLSPHFFLKKRMGYFNRLHPPIHPSVMLSPPKPLAEIQPNLVCQLLTWMGRATAFLALPPGTLGRGQMVKYHLSSIIKSFQRYLYLTLCLCSQTYRMGFSFCHLGHARGVKIGGAGLIFSEHGHVAY